MEKSYLKYKVFALCVVVIFIIEQGNVEGLGLLPICVAPSANTTFDISKLVGEWYNAFYLASPNNRYESEIKCNNMTIQFIEPNTTKLIFTYRRQGAKQKLTATYTSNTRFKIWDTDYDNYFIAYACFPFGRSAMLVFTKQNVTMVNSQKIDQIRQKIGALEPILQTTQLANLTLQSCLV